MTMMARIGRAYTWDNPEMKQAEDEKGKRIFNQDGTPVMIPRTKMVFDHATKEQVLRDGSSVLGGKSTKNAVVVDLDA